jgi:prohibitin 2
MIPWFERPIIYDVRSHPTTIKTTNGTKDMQMVHVQLRVLYRPDQSDLQSLYRLFG